MDSREEKNKKQKRLYQAGMLTFIVFITCFTFPMFNFVKVYSKTIWIVNLLLSVSVYYRFGKDEAKLFAEFPVWKIFLLNLAVVGVGLLCRYLLEFGEVSNTYNFVPLNIIVHVAAAAAISISTYLNQKRWR